MVEGQFCDDHIAAHFWGNCRLVCEPSLSLVLSRNGIAVTGSPWIADTLNVATGETYEVVFIADNPGIWMESFRSMRGLHLFPFSTCAVHIECVRSVA